MYAVRRPGRPLTQCPHKDPSNCGCSSPSSELVVKVKKDEGENGGEWIKIYGHHKTDFWAVSGCACVQTPGVSHDDPRPNPHVQSGHLPVDSSARDSVNEERSKDDIPNSPNQGCCRAGVNIGLGAILQPLNGQTEPLGGNLKSASSVQDVTPRNGSKVVTMSNGSQIEMASRKRKHYTPEPDSVIDQPLKFTSIQQPQENLSCCTPRRNLRRSSLASGDAPLTTGNAPESQSHLEVPTAQNTSQSTLQSLSANAPLSYSSLPNFKSSDTHAGNSKAIPFDLGVVPQTTLYPLPPNYATAQNPMTAGQHSIHQQTTFANAQTVPSYAPAGLSGFAASPTNGTALFESMHNCTCGSACQCLFCAVHPYNSATLQQVHNLAHHLPIGPDYPSLSTSHSPQSSQAAISPSYQPPEQRYVPPQYQPTSISSNSALVSANLPSVLHYPNAPQSDPQYFTLTYQINPDEILSCTDISGSCKCGDDCACVGCLTHTGHTGEPLDLGTS